MRQTREILRFDRWHRRILRVVRESEGLIRIRHLDYSGLSPRGGRWPIYLLEIGKPAALSKHNPLLISGVHGLETIGIRIHLDILRAMLSKKSKFYSEPLRQGKLGIYSIPILNPSGVAGLTRSNARGIDLNRNSGIEAKGAMPFFGGHKISPRLPYYRGKSMERESRALIRFLKNELWHGKNRIHAALDIHSGYGSQNYLWWPYSYTKDDVYQRPAFELLGDELRKRHSLYRIEPMALSYQTHGDLWDLALLEFEKQQRTGLYQKSQFLPYTLEIGTWQEIRKQPTRLFSREKIFNPPPESRKQYLKAHRALIWDFIHMHAKRGDRKVFLKRANKT
jgi:hypothetical protein